MQAYDNPLVDDKNPCYCPTIPAAVYLKSLRCKTRNVEKTSSLHPSLSPYFTSLLGQSVHDSDVHDVEDAMGSDWILDGYFTSGRGWFSSPLSAQDDLPPYSPTESAKLHPKSSGLEIQKEFTIVAIPQARGHGLKRKGSFSDLKAPPKYARSAQSAPDSSFDVELRREQLRYSDSLSSPQPKDHVLTSIEQPKNDMAHLITSLDCALSGIRLKERLLALPNHTPQTLMDFLAIHGTLS